MARCFLTALLLAAAVAHAAVPDGVARIAGSYYGQAFNGGDLDPVTTVLAFDDRGRFTGNYQVEDETGIFEGSLSSLVQEGERSFSMEWTDQDGEGFVYLEFNADYSRFTGVWTTTDGNQQHPWTGRRQ